MEKDKIQKLALRYSGMATAILGATHAQGQVVYTDINPDVTLNTNSAQYDLNIDAGQDNFGVIDYRIVQYVDTTQYDISGVFIQTGLNTTNQVVGLDYANYNYPFKLNPGDEIGVDTVFRGLGGDSLRGQMALEIQDTSYPNDQFAGGVTDGIIGLRFEGQLGDTIETFYGWIRVDVAADLESVTIKDYAYQSQPDSSVLAGEGSPLVGLREHEPNQPELTQRGQILDVKLPESYAQKEGRLQILDLSGKQLREIAFSGSTFRFRLEDLPKGILVARVESNGGVTSVKVASY